MPRRDGLPTNMEMQADFTETARLFYNATLNAVLEQGLHPGLEDKPLPYIRARALHFIDSLTKDIPNSIATEELTVSPYGEEHATILPVPGVSSFETVPPELVAYRQSLFGPISATVLKLGLNTTDLLVPGTVSASYAAFDKDRVHKRSTSSYDDRPSKINIAAGKYLAGIALEHAITHGVIYNTKETLDTIRSGKETMIIKLDVLIDTELPLNGYESRPFLEHFLLSMIHIANRTQDRINRLKNLDAPEVVMANEIKHYESAIAAVTRVRTILEK